MGLSWIAQTSAKPSNLNLIAYENDMLPCRLLKGDMEAVFSGRKRLLPCATDLSYYNWATQTLETSPSEDFLAVSDVHAGFLELENKRDGTAIRVDPSCAPGLYSTRIEVETDEYQQVLLFDHYPAS